MTENTTKRLTIADLINKKDRLAGKRKATKELYIEELDATIVIEKPDRSLIIESSEYEGAEGDDFLVYNCVVEPNLKDNELQKIYDCKEPTEIVSKVFDDIGTIKGIAEQALSMSGLDSKVTAVEELKN